MSLSLCLLLSLFFATTTTTQKKTFSFLGGFFSAPFQIRINTSSYPSAQQPHTPIQWGFACNTQKKRAIVISARVHPGETPSSWMMKGLMDFLTGDSTIAKKLRHKFIFKLIPMLNPDGVIVGNTRSELTGKDLNRQYRTVIRETYPSIWYTKTMIKRLTEELGVSMYCDFHAHSRKHNAFIFGCENKRDPEKKLTEQIFPLMLHKNIADKVSVLRVMDGNDSPNTWPNCKSCFAIK